QLYAVSIEGETATLSAEETAQAAEAVGMTAEVSNSVDAAITQIVKTTPNARILICGSLYLAGRILQENA
ncbi:MAG: bifunctional folylpolyglutamate synthase/dihydrofolate synthase, partial [Rhodobacteraceae bacterium]|nr:bifunctional folylpolyglutamate synthase/dihydrofolate synthase [Paracoccaceae bacterium]